MPPNTGGRTVRPDAVTFLDVIAAIGDAAEIDRLREDYAADRGCAIHVQLVVALVAAATDYGWQPLADDADERATRIADAKRNVRLHAVKRTLSACDPAVAAGYAVTLVDLCDAFVRTLAPYDDAARMAAYARLSDVADRAARAQLDALRFLATHYPAELWP